MSTAKSRARNVRRVLHSAALEGGRVSDDMKVTLSAYVDGKVTAKDVSAMTRARYGITS